METSPAIPKMPQRAQIFLRSVVFFGCIICLSAAYYLPVQRLDWLFWCLAGLTLIFGSRLSVKIPRSEVHFIMGDALIFLTFLRSGGEAAILLAATEAVITSLRLRKQFSLSPYLMVCFNGATMACATAAAYAVVIFTEFLRGKAATYDNIVEFFIILEVMSLSQFAVNTGLVAWGAALQSQNAKIPMTALQAWKKYTLASSITIFAGAAAAGLVYGIFKYSNFIAAVAAVPIVGLIFLGCRQVFGDMRNSYEQTEKAEREKAEAERRKAEAEREKRFQAEQDARKITKHLEEQKRISDALRKSQETIRYDSLHDKLTTLPNRTHFCHILTELLTSAENNTKPSFTTLFINLQRFKTINDNMGHRSGDELLFKVGERLEKIVRLSPERDPRDLVASFGGDKFAVLFTGVANPEKAEEFAKRVQQTLLKEFELSGRLVHTEPTIGIALSNADYSQADDVLRDADTAMHHAKKDNSLFKIFEPAMHDKAKRFLEIETGLQAALKKAELKQPDELIVHYQPILQLWSGKLIGFEALMRWQHPDGRLIPPFDFIPTAEQSGLIIPMTQWILRKSCSQLKEWQNQSKNNSRLFVSVNLSSRHFADPNLVSHVENVLSETNLEPQYLKLEITESMAMENVKEAISIMEKLRDLGVQLSIDDFGTGHSSLSNIHKFPVQTLKIDRSFVVRMGESEAGVGIVQTILMLARQLKLEVIAEGIDQAKQLEMLRDLGCRFAQGFLMSKPLPAAEISSLMAEKTHWLPDSVERLRTKSDRLSYVPDRTLHRRSRYVADVE